MGVIVQNLTKHFVGTLPSLAAVDNVSFEVAEGALVALLGPSGSGKSTILRMIAGLERPDSGRIFLNKEDVTQVPTQKRGIGFVFQHYALFRQLSVFENIAFGLEIRKVAKADIKVRVGELLEVLGLQGLGHRLSTELSGGQQQRVALARALASRPKVLLLDEPFGAIDAKIRQELRGWLRRLHDEMHVTSIFVTHDQEEALEICDKIFVINAGKIEQEGDPQEIYKSPGTEFVANFIGAMNIYRTVVREGKLQFGPYSFCQHSWNNFQNGDEIRIFFRPQDIYVSGSKNTYAQHGVVQKISFMGVNMKIEIISSDHFKFFAIIPNYIFYREKLHEGREISYQIEELQYVNRCVGPEMKRLDGPDYEI